MNLMSQHHFLFQTGLLLSFLFSSCSLMPNIGDVRLFNVESNDGLHSGEAQMYLTDGSSRAQWSSICKSNSFDIDEAMILCKQLGYDYDKILAVGTRQPAGPFLISNIHCKDGKKYKNLLECLYTLEEQNCNEGVFIRCKDNNLPSINGQLELCPPDPTEPPNIISSVSFGVIGIHLRDHWRAIGNSTISQGARNIADLMCVSLGFQTAVSGSPRKPESVNYTFTSCEERYESKSWISMTDIENNCNIEREYPCLGCCLKYPSRPSCADSRLCKNDFMVIQCTFNLFEKNDKQTQQDNCIFSESSEEGDRILNYTSICNRKNVSTGEVALGAFFALFFLSTVVSVVVNIALVYKCIKTHRQAGQSKYEHLNNRSSSATNPMESSPMESPATNVMESPRPNAMESPHPNAMESPHPNAMESSATSAMNPNAMGSLSSSHQSDQVDKDSPQN